MVEPAELVRVQPAADAALRSALAALSVTVTESGVLSGSVTPTAANGALVPVSVMLAPATTPLMEGVS